MPIPKYLVNSYQHCNIEVIDHTQITKNKHKSSKFNISYLTFAKKSQLEKHWNTQKLAKRYTCVKKHR